MTTKRLTSSLFPLTVIAVVMVAADSASAQVQSLGTSRTTTGTTTRTTTGGVSTTAASSSAASSAGSQTQNQNLFSGGGDAAQIGNTQSRFATSQLANQPLATGTTGTTPTTQRAGQVSTVNAGRGGGGGGGFGAGNRNTIGTQNTTRTIRPSLALGFPRVPRPSTEMTQSVGERFAGLSTRLSTIGDTRPQFSGVSFNIGENGAVTLSGTVPDADARRLAANIVRMEPGVRSVTNELEVTAANP